MILLQMARALSPASTSGGSQPFTAPTGGSDAFLWPIGICTQGSVCTERHMDKNKFKHISMGLGYC